MSLRYRLDKERFKGKKLPPKNRTNDDHISADQRGEESSSDDPFSDNGVKHALKQKLAQEADQFSRRGIFSGLNKLKDYANEQDEKQEAAVEKEAKKLRQKKKKSSADESPEESLDAEGNPESVADTSEENILTAEAGETPVTSTESATAEPATEEVAPPKRKGFFKRVKNHFFPSLYGDSAELDSAEPPAPSPGQSDSHSAGTIDMISPTDVVDEARTVTTDVPADEMSEEDERQLDRRHLMKESVHFLAKPAVEKVQHKIDKVNEAMDKITKRPPLLRPPGAISEKQFLQACTRCDKCINACPKDAILKVPKKMGWIIMDTPYIDPMKVPCVMCDDLPCISACQDEALLPVAAPADVQMGYVILDKKHCVAFGDGFCQQCVIDCPVPGAITQKNHLPIFHRKSCTGCGACVRACATVNIPVALKVKPQMVIEAQQLRKQREKDEAEMAIQLEDERKRIEAEHSALKAEETALAKEKGWTDEDG